MTPKQKLQQLSVTNEGRELKVIIDELVADAARTTLRGTVEEFEKNQGRYEQLVELSDMLTIKPTKKESP